MYKDVKQAMHNREREDGLIHSSDEEDPELGKSTSPSLSKFMLTLVYFVRA